MLINVAKRNEGVNGSYSSLLPSSLDPLPLIPAHPQEPTFTPKAFVLAPSVPPPSLLSLPKLEQGRASHARTLWQ